MIKRKTVKRSAKRKTSTSKTKPVSANRKAYWKVYRELQQKAAKAWAKLRSHVKKKADPKILIKDKNDLLLLLGECNYMARECMRCMSKAQKSRSRK